MGSLERRARRLEEQAELRERARQIGRSAACLRWRSGA